MLGETPKWDLASRNPEFVSELLNPHCWAVEDLKAMHDCFNSIVCSGVEHLCLTDQCFAFGDQYFTGHLNWSFLAYMEITICIVQITSRDLEF